MLTLTEELNNLPAYRQEKKNTRRYGKSPSINLHSLRCNALNSIKPFWGHDGFWSAQ